MKFEIKNENVNILVIICKILLLAEWNSSF